MSLLFGATYPDRTAALVVRSAYPRQMWSADYPWGQTEQALHELARTDASPFDDVAFEYTNPLTGGPEGAGWPFGRPVQVGEVFAVLQRVRGVDLVEDVRLFGADPVTGRRGSETSRLELPANSLAFSYQHMVRVEER